MPDIDDKTFEQSLAEMSLATLKSRCPALLDYVMGFQLLERGDDDTKAAGFFGFKIGDHWAYAPAMFINGEIKGLELLYVKGQDMFFPLEEDWVNFLIQKKPLRLGDKDTSPRGRQSISGPDMRILVRPPQASKLSSAALVDVVAAGMATTKVQEWAKEAAAFLTGVSVDESKYADAVERLRFPKLCADLGVLPSVVAAMGESPKLANAVLNVYGMEELADALAKTKVAKVYDAPPSAYSPPKPVILIDRNDAETDEITRSFLSDAEKEKIMSGNVAIRDGRPEEKKRKAYNIDLRKTLENPQAGGLYDMVTSDGGTATVFILRPRVIGTGATYNLRVIVDVKTKTYRFARTTEVWTTKKYSDKEFLEKLADSGKAVSSDAFSAEDEKNDKSMDTLPESGEKSNYIVITQNGDAVMPFRVNKKYEQADGQTSLLVETVHVGLPASSDIVGNNARAERSLSFEGLLRSDNGIVDVGQDGSNVYATYGSSNRYDAGRMQRIVITDKKLKSCVGNASTLLIPKGDGFRVMKVTSGTAELDPGTTADMVIGISKFADAFEVRATGNQSWYVDSRDMGIAQSCFSEKQALDALMNGMGLDAESAWECLQASKKAAGRSVKMWTPKAAAEKVAFPFENLAARSLVQDPWISAKQEESFEDLFPNLPEYKSKTDPTVYKHFKDENSFKQNYVDDAGKLDDAAKGGQKDVFDAAALGTLINCDDINAELESYFPDMLKCLDRCGRTLFLVYWHGEEMKDRFGKDEMKNVEDDMKSVFSKLGEVILRLKKRSPTDPGAFSEGISL